MIIDVKTKILETEKLNLNQLIFLSMVLDKNQKPNQDVRKIVSLINDDDVSYLISQGLITSTQEGGSITYYPTEQTLNAIKPSVDYFEQFYNAYPVYVTRPDGSKSYLRANVHKCRALYSNYTGKSTDMAEHINQCLKFELAKKTREGKIGYMKTMWRWLVDHQWEETEEELSDTHKQSVTAYGTELI